MKDPENTSPERKEPGETPQDPAGLTGDLRKLLLENGFDRVGFADAGSTPGADHFREWLDRGYAGNMDYLARNTERRQDVQKVLEGARGVIVTAMHYGDGGSVGIANPASDRAEISSYARGTDYHRIIEKRLKSCCRLLRERFAGEYRYYVDTGPVLEKAWAQKAGIGWIGKNTCSIDADNGSYFFLGVILTTHAVEPDPPALDHCGSCTLCLEACPTAAFPDPYVLDARRCISYLTIEERGEIIAELEEKMENLVFGCDICQEVCPWNSEPRVRNEPGLAAREENVFPRLSELAELTPESFSERFPQSPIRRAGFRGFLRNVIIALGNSSPQNALEHLDQLGRRESIRKDPLLKRTLERARRRLMEKNRIERSGKIRGEFKRAKIQGPIPTAMAILSALAFLVFWLTWITDKANYGVWIPGLFLYISLMTFLYHLARKKQDGKRENK